MTNVCTMNYWHLLDSEMPELFCNTYHAPQIQNYTLPPFPEMIFNFSQEFAIMYIVSLLVICIFGILMVEWFDKKFIHAIFPLINPIERRYRFVKDREREIMFWKSIN